MKWILVAAGGALGALARFWVGQRLAAATPAAFPLGTFIINLTGCWLIGFLAAWPSASFLGQAPSRQLLMAGFCGAYTTFSAFVFEINGLSDNGLQGMALFYAAGSVVAGLLLFWTGLWMGRLASG